MMRMLGRLDFHVPLAAVASQDTDHNELEQRLGAFICAQLGPACERVCVQSLNYVPTGFGSRTELSGFATFEWRFEPKAAQPDRSDAGFSAAVLDQIERLLDGVQQRIDALWAGGRVFQEQEEAKERLESFVAVPENIRTLVKMARRALDLESGAGKLRTEADR